MDKVQVFAECKVIMKPQLRADIWIKAQVRVCDISLLPVFIRRRGDPDAGAVILKLDRLNGFSEIFVQARAGDGSLAWIRGLSDSAVADAEAELYIQRQIRFDPDVWVLEIEDPESCYQLDGPLLN